MYFCLFLVIILIEILKLQMYIVKVFWETPHVILIIG
jgi:hypothetical protein